MNMMWRTKITEGLADVLRFCVRGGLIIDGIVVVLASVYVVVKLCWFTLRYLDRVWFAMPW